MPTPVTERLDSPRILAGTRGELRLTVFQDGETVDLSSPSVVLTNADTGETITPGTAVAEENTGKLLQVLTAAETATPRRIKAAWTVTANAVEMTFTTYHEVVGDLLFTLAEARAFDGATLADEETYPLADLLAARDVIWEQFEDICGVRFGTAATREILDGNGLSTLWLPTQQAQSVTAAATRSTSTWTALTSDELADLFVSPNGRLVRETLGSWPTGSRNIRVDYQHGHARVPREIRRAALVVLRDQLPGTNLTNRALSQTNEFGTFRIAAPGERGAWFGIPLVDEALRRYARRLPGIA